MHACRSTLEDPTLYFIGGTVAGVVRYDLATKTLKPLGQLLTDVWAVSAMTCVHAPSEADAGADAAPDGAADAGATAADGGP